MYELSMNEQQEILGGYDPLAVGLLTVGALSVILLSLVPSSKRCRVVQTPFVEITPVYDPRTGVYLGDIEDTYLRTETVCN